MQAGGVRHKAGHARRGDVSGDNSSRARHGVPNPRSASAKPGHFAATMRAVLPLTSLCMETWGTAGATCAAVPEPACHWEGRQPVSRHVTGETRSQGTPLPAPHPRHSPLLHHPHQQTPPLPTLPPFPRGLTWPDLPKNTIIPTTVNPYQALQLLYPVTQEEE